MYDAEIEAMCSSTLDEVYRYALRLSGGNTDRAGDLVQDTYVALVRHLRAHPDVHVGLPWLIQCCRHRHIDTIRRWQRRERNQIRAWQPENSPPHDDVSDVALALGRIGEPGRTALVLRHIDGLPVDDVAQALGRSVAATETILRRARQRLIGEYITAHFRAARLPEIAPCRQELHGRLRPAMGSSDQTAPELIATI